MPIHRWMELRAAFSRSFRVRHPPSGQPGSYLPRTWLVRQGWWATACGPGVTQWELNVRRANRQPSGVRERTSSYSATVLISVGEVMIDCSAGVPILLSQDRVVWDAIGA